MTDEIQTRLGLNLEPHISTLQTPGPTPPDQLSVLLEISRELKALNAKLATPDPKAEGASKRRKERAEKINGYIQGANFVSVIAVFTASLGIAFLSLAHDKFADRDPSTGAKTTDHVVYACGLVTVVASLADVILLGFLGQPQIIQALAVNRRINRKASLRTRALGADGEEAAGKGDEGEGGIGIGNESESERSTHPGPMSRLRVADRFGASHLNGDYESSHRLDADDEDEDEQEWSTLDLAKSEETFLAQASLFMSMGPLVIAVEAFLVGTIVLVWAEFAKGTAVAVTLTLLFMGLLSIVYCVFMYLYVGAKP